MEEGPKQMGCFGFKVSSLGTTGPVAPRPKQAGGVGMRDGGREDDVIHEVALKPPCIPEGIPPYPQTLT